VPPRATARAVPGGRRANVERGDRDGDVGGAVEARRGAGDGAGNGDGARRCELGRRPGIAGNVGLSTSRRPSARLPAGVSGAQDSPFRLVVKVSRSVGKLGAGQAVPAWRSAGDVAEHGSSAIVGQAELAGGERDRRPVGGIGASREHRVIDIFLGRRREGWTVGAPTRTARPSSSRRRAGDSRKPQPLRLPPRGRRGRADRCGIGGRNAAACAAAAAAVEEAADVPRPRRLPTSLLPQARFRRAEQPEAGAVEDQLDDVACGEVASGSAEPSARLMPWRRGR
jgi:hypothetical protein